MPSRSTRMRSTVVAAAVLAVAGIPAPAHAATAAAATYSSVTMVSDPGDYIGGGVSRYFDSRNAQITLSGTAGGVGVGVDGGSRGDAYSLSLAPPSGTKLVKGTYTGAQRTSFRAAGRPGIDVSGDGRGCNEISGRFEVRDIAYNAVGAVTRLHALYEQHCEGGSAALFGEIRVNTPTPAVLATEASSVTWPDTYPIGGGTTVPVTVRAMGPSGVDVASATLAGPDAGHFLVRADNCTGAHLEPDDVCQVHVRFMPTAAGPRSAALVLRTTSGASRRVQLDGLGTVGTTAWTMAGDAGDYISGGRSYSYSASRDGISAAGSESRVSVSVDGANGDWWTADFEAPSGDILAPGTYDGATRYPFNGTGPGLSVSGNGRGCNTLTGSFTIKQIAFSPLDGRLTRLQAGFEQHCEGATAALRGEVSYNAASDVVAPARASGLTATPVTRGVRLSFANPGGDYARTVVRLLPGANAPGAVTSGLFGYAGTSTGPTVAGLRTGQSYTFAVYTVDRTGHVGRASLVRATAG
ncbi:MAG: hypothetical protein M3Q27_18045 [Actinomycetota bacterium]|nr:hypothetical protein [Actinomycetota bacterium]